MMTKFRVYNPTGVDLGVYVADTAEAAIEACVRDAGYASVEDMEHQIDQPCELQAKPDDTIYVSISADGVWAGDGKFVRGAIVDCAATLGDEVYDALDDAIGDAIADGKSEAAVEVDGVEYAVTITGAA